MIANTNRPRILNCKDCELRPNRPFCDLHNGALDYFSHEGMHASFERGAFLFYEGDVSGSVIVVCTGQVKLSCTSREGKVLILKIAGAGDVLGLSSAIAGLPHEVTAETIAPTQVKVMSRAVFKKFLEDYPEAGMHTAQSLAHEYRSAFVDARRLALASSAAGRLGRVLLDWAETASHGKSELRFQMALTHSELGSLAGLSRETVTRLLSRFRREKLIAMKGSAIQILDPRRLESLTD